MSRRESFPRKPGLALCWQKEEKRVTAQVCREWLLRCRAYSENEAREVTSETTGTSDMTGMTASHLLQETTVSAPAPRQMSYQQGAAR